MLEPFVGVVGQEQPAGAPDLRSRTVAAADQALSAGLGLDDHFLHHVVQPGQLSRPDHAGVAQQNEQSVIIPARRPQSTTAPPPAAVFGSVTHWLKPLRFRTTV